VDALERRDAGSPALPRYAILGRLLAALPGDVPDAAARVALQETLDAWTTTLAVPSSEATGWRSPGSARSWADARGSSMRTNPILLTDEELAEALAASL